MLLSLKNQLLQTPIRTDDYVSSMQNIFQTTN